MCLPISLNAPSHEPEYSYSVSPNIAILGAKRLFARLGALPFLLLAAMIIFALLSDNFFTIRNLTNVARQSVYLMMVSMGQMFALLTGGFDLSVGTFWR